MTERQGKSMMRAPSTIWLFGLSFLIRLGGIYLETLHQIGGHVAWRYTDIAANIVSGNGFSDAPGMANTFEPPVYPYVLSALFALFGGNLTVVKISQAVLDSLTTCVLFFI